VSPGVKVLVTGGVRSGKSRHAESLLAGAPSVTYVAAGPVHDDADWAARIAAHRSRRPDTWSTEETRDVAGVLTTAGEPVLVDCLGTWLTGVIDDAGLWEAPVEEVESHVVGHLDALLVALTATGEQVVLVTNEVGLGVVPEHRSARVFRDLLGTINQRVAEACDEVHLVIAGRVLRL
jgi:adenosylcobinamide kinase/adenosylcobinamide-phosphate guanylyltransferase